MSWSLNPGPDGESYTYVDTLGFEHTLSKDEADVIQRNVSKDEERFEKYWKDVVAARKLPTRKAQLKLIVRKGVPAKARSWVWPELANNRQRKAQHPEGYYRQLVSEGPSEQAAHQIEVDLPRTFPGHTWMSTPEAEGALRNVLRAFAARQPKIGYCQSMNFIAAVLLLVLNHDEEETFWVMTKIVEDILYPGTFSADLLGAHVEIAAFGDIAASKNPELFKFMRKHSLEPSIYATDWFLCLFCTSLPLETACRVWDSMLLEGGKLLYRAGLATLQLIGPTLMKGTNVGEISVICKEQTRLLYDRKLFMSTCFKHVGSLSHVRIDALRAQHYGPIAKDLEERAAARAERERQRQEEKRKREAALLAEEAAKEAEEEDVAQVTPPSSGEELPAKEGEPSPLEEPQMVAEQAATDIPGGSAEEELETTATQATGSVAPAEVVESEGGEAAMDAPAAQPLEGIELSVAV